jgi:alpha-N-arabinofuranosidase
LRTPAAPCWTLKSEVGQLVLHPGYDDLTSNGHPCFLGRRQQHAYFTADVDLSLKDSVQTTDAGLAIFQNEHSFFFFGVRTCSLSSTEIFVEQESRTALAPTSTTLARKQLPAGNSQLKLRITNAGPKV